MRMLCCFAWHLAHGCCQGVEGSGQGVAMQMLECCDCSLQYFHKVAMATFTVVCCCMGGVCHRF